MNKFYLNTIIEDSKDTETAIIQILKARGFFIDKYEDGYYLSDNASIPDAQYLSQGLSTYAIGRVIDKKEYVEKSRPDWNWRGRPYTYKTLCPKKVKIIISKEASIQDAIAFFHSRGQIRGEACSSPASWARFTTEILSPKISVEYLEAYVAFYVKAISACGVSPYISCDGNHIKNGGKIYIHSNYPSEIWHKNIWKYIVQPEFGPIPCIEDGITFNQNNQEEVYQSVYAIAQYLYKNRAHIRWLKELSVENITKKYRKTHGQDEIEQFFREECKRVLAAHRHN